MKKIILLLAVLALSFGTLSCGGGGAGSSSSPSGENPGVASVVELGASHYIAQTNSNITLHAKVLDGNGHPLPGVTVTFTNLSEPLGVLRPLAAPTTAVTDGLGIASLNLYSTVSGFATIVAQVYNGVGTVRDRKTVFFTTRDVVAVTMDMDVDSVPGNGVFNETNDVTLFQDPPIPQPDDTVKVRVTVRDGGGVPVGGGESVSWSTSHAEAVITRSDTITSTSGIAEAIVQVTPTTIRNTETLVNVMASAGNGAANMVTLFLRKVVIDPTKSSVTANPSIVDTKGTSDVTAIVFLNTGATVPNNTIVNFTTAPKTAADPSPCGTITPFVPTTSGITNPPAKFTAPLVPGVCTVTAKSGGVTIGSVDITVIEKLTVQPSALTINGVAGGVATFTIYGGVPSYTVIPNNVVAWAQPVPATVTASGGSFVVTVPANTPASVVTYTIKDKTGSTVTATLTVTGAGSLSVTPSTLTMDCPGVTSGNFLINGGVAPYTVTSLNPALVTPSAVTPLVPPPGGTFTVTTGACPAASTPVTVVVRDSAPVPAQVLVTITVTPPAPVPPPPTPDFTFACTPTSVDSVTTTSTCTVTAVNGYVGTVALSCTPIAGDTLTLSPSIVVPTGTSTLTYTCGLAHPSAVVSCTATGTPAGSGPKTQSIVATCP